MSAPVYSTNFTDVSKCAHCRTLTAHNLIMMTVFLNPHSLPLHL